jgi:hypothetical protein
MASLPFISTLDINWLSFLCFPLPTQSARAEARLASCMVKATSGHIVQHNAQYTHLSGRTRATGKYPLIFTFADISRTLFGQTVTHNAQPLQRCALILYSMVICFVFLSDLIENQIIFHDR